MGTDTSGTQPEDSTLTMLGIAVEEARALIQVEAKLTRNELQEDLHALKVTAVLLLLSLQLTTLALAMLLVAVVLGLVTRPPLTALVIGLVLGVAAVGFLALGYRQRPSLLEETRQRLSRDRELVKNLEALS